MSIYRPEPVRVRAATTRGFSIVYRRDVRHKRYVFGRFSTIIFRVLAVCPLRFRGTDSLAPYRGRAVRNAVNSRYRGVGQTSLVHGSVSNRILPDIITVISSKTQIDNERFVNKQTRSATDVISPYARGEGSHRIGTPPIPWLRPS